jgi:glycosyltransferase involved in cell wall biosynthesis
VRLLTRDGADARVVARGDASALASAINGLLADPEERARLGRQARIGMESYRPEVVLDAWERLIANALR